MERRGRKSAAQTPAPPKERIYGSTKNPKGSAASKTSASSIKLSVSALKTLKDKKDKFNKEHPKNKVELPALKAVMRRGMGAYSKSHRPTITGGAPNSRQAWGFARVNKFLKKKSGEKVKAAYVQDDDLLEKGGELPIQIAKDVYLSRDKNSLPKDAIIVAHRYNDKLKAGKEGLFAQDLEDSEDTMYGKNIVFISIGKDAKIKTIRSTFSYLDNIDELEKPNEYLRQKYGYDTYLELDENRELLDNPNAAYYEIQKKALEEMRKRGEDFEVLEMTYEDDANPHQWLITTLNNPDIKYQDGGLIAPNGKKSNLTPEQYKLVRTPEFKAWFGDWENDPANASKVVDENGEPLVVYHGSSNNFNIFSKGVLGEIHFIDYKEYAEGFGNHIYECFLDIKKPFYVEYNYQEIPQGFDGNIFKNFIKSKYQELSKIVRYGVFEPTQIKLADGSNTTFDANNPDIRYAKGGEMKDSIALPDTTSSYDRLKDILKNQGYELKKINMDLPVGKLAKGMTLSEVAAIHGLQADDLKAELKMGIETEMEHTDVAEYARAIALDHLYEDPKYYTKLKKMEGIDSHYKEISKKFAEGGQVDPIFSFKTPTGEPSRLNYLQQVLVRTQGFKEFFGDWELAAKSFLLDGKENFEKHYKNVSKVIDYVTLEPRVVFHGTRAEEEFFRFDVTKEKGVGRPYGYFAHNKEYSDNFTQFSQRTSRQTTPLLYKCFVNIRNPFYATTSEYWMKSRDAESWLNVITGTIVWHKYKTISRDNITKELDNTIDSQIGDYVRKVYDNDKAAFWRLMAADAEKDFKYFLMAYGFDGVFYGEEFKAGYDPENPAEYTQAVTIFDSKQVKLADGRNLNFNPLLDDIRYEYGGMTDENGEQELSSIHFNMSKKAKLGMLIGSKKYAEGGHVETEHGLTNDGKKGGYFKGRSHADGGIKAINKDTGQLIEVEGEEVIITKGAVNDETKREFEGEMLTNREILSRINQSGGGVAFEDGGEIKGHTCGCSGKKYKFGGELYEDYNIIRFMNDPTKLASYTTKSARSFADSLVEKMK